MPRSWHAWLTLGATLVLAGCPSESQPSQAPLQPPANNGKAAPPQQDQPMEEADAAATEITAAQIQALAEEAAAKIDDANADKALEELERELGDG